TGHTRSLRRRNRTATSRGVKRRGNFCCFPPDFEMNRRVRLTLMMVGLVALLSSSISAYWLATGIGKEFQAALDRAGLLKSFAADRVGGSLEAQPTVPVPEALAKDTELSARLANIMAISHSLLEITVCDSANKVLVSTDATRRVGGAFPAYPDYEQLARHAFL